ncbi:CHAT domain-containing tetratricopeptide repeat protein [Streptomyces sp. NPDC002588]|uniref:CHAT domain-containing tetratricopeptide repeat protein n=1 Tax=Streptomyces sp. NPDC002588 TaxID=3154419 RepID=UPI003323BF35
MLDSALLFVWSVIRGSTGEAANDGPLVSEDLSRLVELPDDQLVAALEGYRDEDQVRLIVETIEFVRIVSEADGLRPVLKPLARILDAMALLMGDAPLADEFRADSQFLHGVADDADGALTEAARRFRWAVHLAAEAVQAGRRSAVTPYVLGEIGEAAVAGDRAAHGSDGIRRPVEPDLRLLALEPALENRLRDSVRVRRSAAVFVVELARPYLSQTWEAERGPETAEALRRWTQEQPPGAEKELARAVRRVLTSLMVAGRIPQAVTWACQGDAALGRLAAHPQGLAGIAANYYQSQGRQDVVAELLGHALAGGRYTEEEETGLVLRLSSVLTAAGRMEEGAALLRRYVSDPPRPEQRDILAALVLHLQGLESSEAQYWQAALSRVAPERDTARLLPDRSGMPSVSPSPSPGPVLMHYENDTVVVAPEIGGLRPDEVMVHMAAAQVLGFPEGRQWLRDMMEHAPQLAARVCALLGLPYLTRPQQEAVTLIEEGEAHFRCAEWEQAASKYQAALDREPDSGLALLLLGEVHFVQGRLDLARVHYQESLAIEESALAWRYLGDTFRNRPNGTEAARHCYTRALELDPEYGFVRLLLDALPSPVEPGRSVNRGWYTAKLLGLSAGHGNTGGDTDRPDRSTRGMPRERVSPAHVAPGTDRAGLPISGPEDPGIDADTPAQLERTLVRRHPAMGPLLDALDDDARFAAWLDEWWAAHWNEVAHYLSTLAFLWNARAGNLERAWLLARRSLQIVARLDEQWPDGRTDGFGRARLISDRLSALALVLDGMGRHGEAYARLREAEVWLHTDWRERARAGVPRRTAVDRLAGSDPVIELTRELLRLAERCGDAEAAKTCRLRLHEWGQIVPPTDQDRISDVIAEGLLRHQGGDMDGALEQLHSVLALTEEGDGRNRPLIALAHRHLGRLLGGLGLCRTALHHLERARELNADNADRLAQDWTATAELLRGRPDLGSPVLAYEQVLLLSGVPGSAGDPLLWRPRGLTADGAERQAHRILWVERVWPVLRPMAETAWDGGEFAMATDVLELAVDLADLVRASQPDPDLRRRLQSERAETYALLMEYSLKLAAGEAETGHDSRQQVARAFMTAERLRSRRLLDVLSTARLRPPQEVPAELLDREAELLKLRAKAERQRIDWAARDRTVAELEDVWTKMGAYGADAQEYVGVRRSTVADPATVLADLAGERVVVASYARLPAGDLVVFALTPDHGLTVRAVDGDIGQITRFVADNMGRTRRVRELVEDAPDLFHVLDPLVAPLAELSRPEDTVLICPTGALHHVPFHALALPGGSMLLDRNPVAYLPTVSVLRTLRRRPPGGGAGAVVLGDTLGDLPYARAEAEILGRRLGGRPLLGPKATRAEVLRRVPGAEVFHAACHAAFDADDPLSSGLVLADGVLTARDILRQDWDGLRLAVLSACETGLGDESRTDETLGLSRSLLYAGARSLVASLWRVPDAPTATIMGDFHDLTLSGEAPGQALRTAMLTARNRSGRGRIDQWAAFCLLGEWRAGP